MATRKQPQETIEQLETEAPQEPALDAVIIVKKIDDAGSIVTDVITNGSVQATEVQTLIEVGLQSWRKKIGLEV